MALQSLFETLFTLSRTLAPFTPFMAETTFAELRRFVDNPDKLGLGADLRSVHFVPFPAARAELADPVIERQVLRMQTVIDLVRQVRQEHSVFFKTPLRSLLVYHPDAEYLADVRTLTQYILEELNVRDVDLTDDEARCGVRWRLTAEWPVIGRKLRGAVGAVKAALPQVSSDDVKAFLRTGEITVAGQSLVREDLGAVRYVELPPPTSDQLWASKTDGDVVVLLDLRVTPEFVEEANACVRAVLGPADPRRKELCNRVTRSRKQAGLTATDEIEVYIDADAETTSQLLRACAATRLR